jgi:hypothetical protein
MPFLLSGAFKYSSASTLFEYIRLGFTERVGERGKVEGDREEGKDRKRK